MAMGGNRHHQRLHRSAVKPASGRAVLHNLQDGLGFRFAVGALFQLFPARERFLHDIGVADQFPLATRVGKFACANAIGGKDLSEG
jgi:hypothetical protein